MERHIVKADGNGAPTHKAEVTAFPRLAENRNALADRSLLEGVPDRLVERRAAERF